MYLVIVYQTELLLWYELLLICKNPINWTIVSIWTIINLEKSYQLNYYLVRTIIRMLRVIAQKIYHFQTFWDLKIDEIWLKPGEGGTYLVIVEKVIC